MDPRYKFEFFKRHGWSDLELDLLLEAVRRLLWTTHYKPTTPAATNEPQQPSLFPEEYSSSQNMTSILWGQVNSMYNVAVTEDPLERDELEVYLKEPRAATELLDVLQWWKVFLSII
jgi:hypothetical protein